MALRPEEIDKNTAAGGLSAAALALGLPLIDVLELVGVRGHQRIGALEESTLSVRGEIRNQG